MTAPLSIGIDVCKATLDIATSHHVIAQVPNTVSGLKTLLNKLKRFAIAHIVIESTGMYSRLAADILSAQYTVLVVQPGRVRFFARSQGIHAKTDRIDAQVIARYGETHPPVQPYQTPSVDEQKLRAFADRRDQITDDIVREKNRLESCVDATIARAIQRHITALKKEAKRLDTAIRKNIEANPAAAEKRRTLEQQPGVAQVTSTCLLTHLPELGTVNRQEIAALAGLAPMNRDSGSWSGQRTIYGGRKRVRTALYMATLSAVKFDPVLKTFYQNLKIRGKKPKVALIACARKLLVKLNSAIANMNQQITLENQ